jgi:hypothetical protein
MDYGVGGRRQHVDEDNVVTHQIKHIAVSDNVDYDRATTISMVATIRIANHRFFNS